MLKTTKTFILQGNFPSDCDSIMIVSYYGSKQYFVGYRSPLHDAAYIISKLNCVADVEIVSIEDFK